MKRGSYGIENCEECKRALRCPAAIAEDAASEIKRYGEDAQTDPEALEEMRERLGGCVRRRMAQAHMRLMNEKGQGTTEYAILVGVLVVMAIVAITMFRPKIEELWNAIANGINGL